MGTIEQVKQLKLAEAKEQGLEQGRQEERRLFVENLLSNTSFSAKKIADLVGVTVAFLNKVKPP